LKQKKGMNTKAIPFFLFVVILPTFIGCLSIGAKTISGTDPVLESRVVQLENRINSLEQFTGISPPQQSSQQTANIPKQNLQTRTVTTTITKPVR
jgi:hypothetical protein